MHFLPITENTTRGQEKQMGVAEAAEDSASDSVPSSQADKMPNAFRSMVL